MNTYAGETINSVAVVVDDISEFHSGIYSFQPLHTLATYTVAVMPPIRPKGEIMQLTLDSSVTAKWHTLFPTEDALEAGYQAMAADTSREQEAWEWIEAHPGEALE